MRPALRVFGLCIVAFSALAGIASASTVAPPANLGELARISKTVVLAEALDSFSEVKGGLPWTVTRFEVIDHVAGEQMGLSAFEVEEIGADVGESSLTVAGAPVFEAGARYLLFLDASANGRWRPKMLSYGLLKEEAGVLRPLKSAESLHVVARPGAEPVTAYRTEPLLLHLKGVAVGTPWQAKSVVARPSRDLVADADADGLAFAGEALNAPAECNYLRSSAGNLPVRWFGFESGASVNVWHTTPGQAGIGDGGVSAVQQAIAAWNAPNNSTINLNFAGSRANTANCSDADARERFANEVIFNDPCNQLPALGSCGGTLPPGWSGNCCGTVAIGGVFHNSNQAFTYNRESWRPAESLFVVVNDGSQCLGDTDFREMITHNIGHGLAFDHHNDQDATMFGQLGVHPPRGAAISTTDARCAVAAYHSFVDVPLDYWAWRWIEAIQDASVTGGCGGGNYCPDSSILRETMAVFLLVAMEGAGYAPPACTTPVFADVPCSSPFAPWINELSARGVVAGCGGGNYCPKNPVTREQMAVFLVKTKEGPAFTAPACTSPTFSDVPCSSPFAPWVEELVDRGITAGCNPGQYCPTSPVTRAQMAVFLSSNFALAVPPMP
ncbi:MAG TPA: S-layer homology domain-containing protein [Thermoanaerobaculia bacterium]|nr:S-layer homology domain-containing protein [Thermoanaerobaculia bacterium]